MVFNTLKFIYTHPYNTDDKFGGLIRFFTWQINCKLNRFPVIYQYTENTKFIVWKGLRGATGNIYCGLLEYEEMGFLLHFLRKDDLFYDIGANVGAYTLLASGEAQANTIAVEPVPSTFEYLSDNIIINKLCNKVKLLNIGLGNDSGIIKFTKSLDTVNHVATDSETDTIDVQINRMDDISESIPILIKIDVEGFETEVLKGGMKILSHPNLKAIIIELNGSGLRYGYDEKLIHKTLIDLGFKTFKYNPDTRELITIPSFGSHNTLYIRDEHFVLDRVSKARKIKIGHRKI